MFRIERRVGRFAELRFGSIFNITELPLFRSKLADIWHGQSGKLVFCVDLRALDKFGPEEEKTLIGVMQADNPRVERSAMLVNPSGRFGVQVLKMIQEADNRARRVLREPKDVQSWLAPVLSAAEAARLEEFLSEKD
jgi:hypothetical protein